MKNRIPLLALAVLVAACGDTPTEPTAMVDLQPAFAVVTAVSVANHSFETGLNDWNAVDVDRVDSGLWQAADGAWSIDLNAFSPGYVSQDISTEAGVEYTVTFALAGNPGHPQGVKPMEVSAAGTSAVYEFDTSGRSGSNMGWTDQTFTFTATGSTTTLTFKSLYDQTRYIQPWNWRDRAQGAAIDNIRVTFTRNDPVTVDECKKGGWESFGFRNQGQCIRFVNTGKDSR